MLQHKAHIMAQLSPGYHLINLRLIRRLPLLVITACINSLACLFGMQFPFGMDYAVGITAPHRQMLYLCVPDLPAGSGRHPLLINTRTCSDL